MNTTHADITDGTRHTLAVEFISQRTVDCEGESIQRLVVADRSDTQFTLLVAPDRNPIRGLQTGEQYRIAGVLGASPVAAAATISEDCPHCDGTVRPGSIADAVDAELQQASVELSLDDQYGILDSESSIQAIDDDGDIVDDWIPMESDSSVTPPEYVCTSCGRQLNERDLRVGGQAEDVVMDAMAEPAPAADASMASQETVGLAAGGAKDVANFRENIAAGHTPQPEAISDEGLFYDYHFETGQRAETEALFAPRYAAAVSDHPITGETEQYLSVGLDSSLSVEDFHRPRLDLVAVLDISGSMDSAFDQYYYDEHGRKQEAEQATATKLEAAIESLCALTEQLHAEDRLGVVLYDHRAHVAKPLRDVGSTDMPAIRRHIREITAGGSTNLADGFEAAVDMLVDETPQADSEQRVVFMTDMMPNAGTTGEDALTELFAEAAVEGIHTTFVGMGLDANAELAETLSGIRGANHYFIHSAEEFKQRLGDEFDYMVTPLVYDLTLEVEADGYEIAAVHGSPTAEDATERLMHVGTLFPSAKQEGEARGGVILVRLTQTSSDPDLELQASWTERNGGQHTERVSVTVPETTETYGHNGVRKAIALARYARSLRSWASEVHDRADNATGVDDWLLPDQRGQHERESVPLVVPDEYNEQFAELRNYLTDEIEAVDDETLQQEVDLLGTLCEDAPATPQEVTES